MKSSHSGPKGAPESVEIGSVKAMLESASGTTEASIKIDLKGIMVAQVVLLPVAALGLGGLPPSCLIPPELLITMGGMAWSGDVPWLTL